MKQHFQHTGKRVQATDFIFSLIKPSFTQPKDNGGGGFSKRINGDHLIYLITELRIKEGKAGVMVTEEYINIMCSDQVEKNVTLKIGTKGKVKYDH